MDATTEKETLGFQAEVKQLLQLMIHSLYSNREIFLRELISNASDACDKLRFEAIDRPELLDGGAELGIRVIVDAAARTIAVSDNGIGMTRQETIEHLGTIARSGTREFFSRLTGEAARDAHLIGQFGVGFYSSFIVADRVTVLTRRAGATADEAVRWESDGTGSFTIEPASRAQRGTDVILHLRAAAEGEPDELAELLNEWRVRAIIKKYSDHVSLPIRLVAAKPGDKAAVGGATRGDAAPDGTAAGDRSGDAPDQGAAARDGAAEAAGVRSDAAEGAHAQGGAAEGATQADAAPSQAASDDAQPDGEVVNQASALWRRAKSEITDEQYREFYHTLSHDSDDPLAWTHARVEGRSEYVQLLYLPSRAPFDLWDRERRTGLKLYVRRVFIMDDAEQLMPAYLRFVRGVIDSNDLPLNVSREILQESRDVRAIREGGTKRVLSMLEDLAANQPDKWTTFWGAFGQVLKEGVGEDFANRDRIVKLLRFASTANDSDAQTVSLADYVGRMKPGQDSIYYVTADGWAAASASPHLEVFRRKGVEVLLLTDRVDEWMLSFLHEFEGKPLASVARADLNLDALADEADKKEAETAAEALRPLIERIKPLLAERAKDVRTTSRLTDSPACLVSAEGDMSGHLERLLRQAGQKVPERKPILELNPKHPLVRRLAGNGGEAPNDAQLADWAALLFDQALLAEGGQLADAAGFVKRLNAMLVAMSLR